VGNGITVQGSLTASNVLVSGNGLDGVRIEQGSSDHTVLDTVTIDGNAGDGVRFVAAPASDVTFADDEPSADAKALGVVIVNSIVRNNRGAAGLEIGAGQSGDIWAFVAATVINDNLVGVRAAGEIAEAHTSISLLANDIVRNRNAGVSISRAWLRDVVFSGLPVSGFSRNIVANNGFAADDNTCSEAEASSQIQVAGFTDESSCRSDVADRCVFNSTPGTCTRGYRLSGGTSGVCELSNTNVIGGYAGDTGTNQTGFNVVGLTATGGAVVDATGNRWKHSTPALDVDIDNDAASFILRAGSCPAANICPAPIR
jgi:hypothetical protein